MICLAVIEGASNDWAEKREQNQGEGEGWAAARTVPSG